MSGRLLLDMGNSRLKWRLDGVGDAAARGALALTGTVPLAVDTLLAALPARPHEAWISSVVAAPVHALILALQAQEIPAHQAHSQAELDGLVSGYRDPLQLGVDRFLALLGARQWRPAQDCLVIDAGTALTVDLLRRDGQHLGGCILPGLGLMAASLAGGTDRLGPYSQARTASAAAPGSVADHTAAAIGLGIDHAALGAIERIRHPRPDWPILICGGDAERLAAALDASVQFQPDLVLDGLAHYARLAQKSALRPST